MKEFLPKYEKIVFLLFVLLSSFALNANMAHAQTLKTDGAVPTLNACGANGTFTVTIAKGSTVCNSGTLKIEFPATGFEYVAGSAKIGGAALAETNVTVNGATFTLPVIPAGPPADLITITYEAKATCEAIPLASLPDANKPTVTYTLNGCGAAPQTGQSDIININFAVLKVEVTPNASQGVIGSVITRVVKVTNTGNGSIGSFTVDRTLGASLSVTSVTQPLGWTVDASTPNKYIYSGATLAPGTSAEFTENVKIDACTAMQTTFDAYYGCVGKCILGNANGTVTAGISIDQSIQPKLAVTVNTSPVINCLNQEYEHVWTIKNNGTGVSSVTKLFLVFDGSSAHAGSYFNENSITVGGFPVTINPSDTQLIPAAAGVPFGTGGKIRQLSFNIPDLAPGESKEIRFKQYYAAPVADCSKNISNFFRTYTAYRGTYKHRDGCNAAGTNPDIELVFAQTKANTNYAFTGANTGEVDIVDNYNADFLINTWAIPGADMQAGAYFDIILELSASLTIADVNTIKIYNPVTDKYIVPDITNLGSGKYRLRINSGTTTWPAGANFIGGGYHLQFPATMDCAVAATASYTITGQLSSGTGCAQLIQFPCQTIGLNAHCSGSCPTGGLDNGLASLKRMTYGQVANSPDDATPASPITNIDPNSPPAGIATRSFIGSDILQISQTGKVINGTATPVGGWNTGTFSVTSPADLKSVAVPASGKVTITRGGTVYTATGLSVVTSANKFTIDISVANLQTGTHNIPLGFAYQDNDVIVSSLEIQPMELFNAVAGLKQFPTDYNLSNAGTAYSCSGNFTATGYYGQTWLQFFGGSGVTQLTSCTPIANPSFLFLFRQQDYARNLLFPNEFRQVATPKKAIFNVPEGIELVGIRVDINNNSITAKTKTIPVSVTGESYALDVEQVIKDLKGGGVNPYLDEGFEVRIYPLVVPTCKSTGTDVMTIEGTMAGTFWHRSSDFVEHQYINSPEVSLGIALPFTYQTDNALLSATVSQANVNATTNQVKWVVQVANSSGFRTFNNVWMGQSAATAGANIVSIQQVTDLNGTTPVGAAVTAMGGVYQLGDFGTGAIGNKYYQVTADYTGCDPGNISMAYGADCNGYPTSVASASCSTALPVTLNYTPVFANLQTSIVSQNAGTARPKLCELLPYEIEVNNAGIGDATTLVVSVPLPLSGGLNYVANSFQLTGPFTAAAGAYAVIADASVAVNSTAITFTIPAANVPALKNGEKFRLKFNLTTQDCAFKSGQRISFIASGKNGCGSDIATKNAASSNRVTIEGSPTNLPELSITLSSVAMNLTTAGTDLTADYNFTLKNVGDGTNNYPATTAYSFNIKLPAGWVFAGSPQDLVPAAEATYAGLDPVKGYVFNLAQDLNVGGEIKIVNATLVYANTATLACNTDLGPIYESAYTTFSPVSVCTGTVCQIDQLSVEHQGTSLAITKPTSLTGTANQTFCAGSSPTLAEIVLANKGIVVWYDSPISTTPLVTTTALVDGQIYYASNQLVAGSVCESDRFAVTVKVDAQPTATAGTDQTIYATGLFTIAGNVPAAGMTGLWTEIIPVGGTAQATIASPTDYNTTITMAAGETATLRWTITNGSCTATDDVVLAYELENDLAVVKTADKATIAAGEVLVYTIKITNNGPGSLLANDLITLTETLPAALTNITYAATGGVYDAAANTFKLDAAMGTAQSVSLTINGTVAADYQGTSVVNKVSIAPPAGTTDSDPSNNTTEVTTPVTRLSDLAVLKIADKASVVAGDGLQYTITITNNGPSTLLAGESIGVTETLPAGFNGLTYAATGGVYDATANTFKLDAAMATGQSVSFTITGTVDANYSAVSIANTVSVTPPTGVTDPVPGNNTSTVTTPVTREADLAVVKIADKASVVAGDGLQYTITITNNGPSALLAGETIGVTETLPTGLNNLTYAATGGIYSASGNAFKLDAAMATGQSVSFTINGTVSANYSATSIANTVSITPPTGVTDPVPGNNTSKVTTPVTRAADLAVVKTADKTSVVAGDALKYTITITNNGLSTLFAGETIGITETLPAGFNNLSYTSTGGTYSTTNNNFTLAAAMGTGQSVSFTISGTVSAAYSATAIVNKVSITPPTGVTDPVPGNNTSTVTTPVTRVADLAVLKTADKTSVAAGEVLVYTIKITNNGRSTLLAGEAIKVTETLPTGFNGLTYAATGGVYDAAANTFKLDAAMATGQTVSFTITGTVDANYSATSIANTVNVTPPTGVTDPVPGNNTSTVTTPVTRVVDLSVVKTANKATVIAGDALTYTIAITNNGPSALLANDAIKITENLPAGFNNLSYTSTGGTYSAASGTFTLSSSMANGQTVSFTITGTVAANYSSGNIANTVTIAPPTGLTDPVPGNNTATVVTPVTRFTDLSVIKTASKTTVVAGETLIYTLTITNNGQSSLFANEVIQVVETLPTALNNVTFTSTDGNYNNGAFKLAADLIKGSSIVITVTGTVSSATLSGSSITNVVAVTVPTGVTDPVPGNNTDDESTSVTRVADLSVVKTASSMAPVVGNNFTFTIKAKNNGPSDASLVSVTDLLSSGYKYVSSATNTGTFTEATGIWAIGNLTKGTEVTLTITVNVLASGNYVNTATINGKETDPNLTDNTSTVAPVPAPSPPVAVDDAATTKANNSVLIPVLVNDHPGLSGSPLVLATLEIIANPSYGTLKVNADGTVTYTPNHGYIGVDNFTYRVQDALGYWSNVATVKITITSNELKIPNVFTPNGDGKNDTFEIFGIEGYDNATITIFNRWGNEVYRNTAYQNNWDGNGLNEGTYYYLIKLKKNGKEDVYKGWVLLKH